MKIVKDRKIYSVSEVNYFAKETLEQMIVWVEGEISELKKNPNYSFYYLTLKDDRAALPCIVNSDLVNLLGGNLVNQRVIAFGNLTVYEPYGKYQLRIQHLETSGEGDLYKKLEKLIKKLREEGLFDARHKKDLPLYPKKVCLITSKGSDAWHDFITHSTYKFPIIEITDIDTRVQGVSAISSLLNALAHADSLGADIVVITRGGGSLEDLAAFNDEQVARAIFNMDTPTVVAIGHEANGSLAEWVADARASTPTDAANIATRGWQNILEKLNFLELKLSSKHERFIDYNLQKLDYLYSKLGQTKTRIREYPYRIQGIKEALKHYEKIIMLDISEKEATAYTNLKRQSKTILSKFEDNLSGLNRALKMLSPQNVLERGYSITKDKHGRVVKNINDVVLEDIIAVKLFHGTLVSKVKSKINEKGS
jgi:exodeoxyribonuclease VII large subunit